MQALIGKAMSLIDLIWEREIEAAPWDTPERAAALKKRLRDVINSVGDRDVKALYGQEIKNRLDKLLGETGVPYYQNGGRQNSGWRSPQRQRLRTQPTSEVRRSALATGADDWSPREALIVLCVLLHPALLVSQRDLFEGIEMRTTVLDQLRYDIIDYIDALAPLSESADGLDNGALTRHLIGKGKQEICERLVNMPEARRMSFARKESDLEDVLAGWLEVTRNHHKLQTLTTEQKSVEAELEIELARDGTQNALDRLLAIKNEIAALERGDDSAA
jgi:DNA primase